jgi:hypothetical protein
MTKSKENELYRALIKLIDDRLDELEREIRE